MWQVREDNGEQVGFRSATTDADGRFTVSVDFYGRDRAPGDRLRSHGRRHGDRGRRRRQARKSRSGSAPLVRVHGKFESKDLGRAVPWTNVYMNLLPGKIRVIQNSSQECRVL